MLARKFHKPVLFVLALIPLGLLILDALTGRLSANPIEDITHSTGDWAIRFLLITLAVTPLRKLTGWSWPGPLRRMLGLFAFFYALLHFLTWLVLDQFFDWNTIVEDIIERPYITVGFLAFVMLIPLAITSTNGMVKRLGGKRWKALHKLVYPIGMLAVLHYLWLVKADWSEPVVYGVILAALLGFRLKWFRAARQAGPGIRAEGRRHG
ncbi:MAG: sulfite oxidase heme-binding subunit YedZ [Gammaproteobacteria bacterium]